MINLELSQIFYRIADLLEMKEDDTFFESRAYSKAARVLETLDKDAEEIYTSGGLKALQKIPGVGKVIATGIEEFIKTGKVKAYQKLKRESPVDIESLMNVEGLGPRKIKILYKELGVKNLSTLEKMAKAGKISKLEGFGEKSEENILQGIDFAKRDKGRFLLGSILPFVRSIIASLEKLPQVERVSIAGSARRMKETVGDIDILVVSSKPSEVMNFFTGMPEVVKVWAKGSTKSSVRFRSGFDCDLRVIKKQSFGAALQYFTGSKDHNILTRRIAIKKGLKLNEYGVFSIKRGKEKKIAGQSEKGVYKAIGLPYIEPELRTSSGEIEAAMNNELPKLVKQSDILGDCHCHTNWSDGIETIEQMAEAAKKMGYQYIAITDHAGFLSIANGMNEKRLLSQVRMIDKISKKIKGIRILKGAEVDIRMDGTMAIDDKVLSKLDLVLASVHSGFKMNKSDMTKRLIRAIENPYVSLIAHPTGRVILKRKAYSFDFKEVFKAAKENRTALGVDGFPERLDLKDTDIRRAIEAGVKLVVSTDSHSSSHLPTMELGVSTARRGWAQKKDILNTRSAQDFLKYFKK